jgi:hypothetical protein
VVAGSGIGRLAGRFLAPQAMVSAAERARAIRYLLIDAAAGTAIGAINSGVVLLALALHIGVSNVEVGLLASIPLITQMLQAPTVTLIERVRRRRLISVTSLFLARLALPLYATVPLIGDRDLAASVLLAAALLHYGLNAVAACSWNSWIRDLVPAGSLGGFSSRRGLVGTAVSAVATVAAAFALRAAEGSESLSDTIFTALYLIGFGCGLVSIAALARVPEPVMTAHGGGARLRSLLWRPLKDRNYRNILRYLASWQFAVNLATPFFTVYIVRELGFGMSFVLMLTVASQLANIAVVRGWGQLSDRYANKSVLAAATPWFSLCIGGMAFASELEGTARAAYLLLLHVVMGAAGAGVGLASGNIVMKLSPEGSATSYMATNALVGALAAGIAPIIGGWTAEFFSRRRLELNLRWESPSGVDQLLGVAFSHWEFFFLLSAAMGLYTLHRLSVVEEPGTVAPREIAQHVWSSARRTLRNVSSVAGLRLAVSFPAADLITARARRRFLLEPLFEGAIGKGPADSSRKAVGALLQSAFDQAPPAPELDEMLAQLR